MIICIIKDSSGNEIGRFQPRGEKNLLDEAAESGIELPFSCHAGACMSCAAKLLSGADFFDQEKDGMKYIDTDDDVVLTCIGGVKQEFVADSEQYIMEIEMLMD